MIEEAKAAGREAEIVAFDGAYHAFDHPGLKVRTRIARNSEWTSATEREVHIGSNPAAREAAITRLRQWLQR